MQEQQTCNCHLVSGLSVGTGLGIYLGVAFGNLPLGLSLGSGAGFAPVYLSISVFRHAKMFLTRGSELAELQSIQACQQPT